MLRPNHLAHHNDNIVEFFVISLIVAIPEVAAADKVTSFLQDMEKVVTKPASCPHATGTATRHTML